MAISFTGYTRPHPLAAQIIAKGRCPEHRSYQVKTAPKTDCKWCRLAWRMKMTEQELELKGEAR